MTLRELRLWHWNKVVAFRKKATEYEAHAENWEAKYPSKKCCYARNKAKFNHARANWHLRAVQALNDCFPVDDSVHSDYKENGSADLQD